MSNETVSVTSVRINKISEYHSVLCSKQNVYYLHSRARDFIFLCLGQILSFSKIFNLNLQLILLFRILITHTHTHTQILRLRSERFVTLSLILDDASNIGSDILIWEKNENSENGETEKRVSMQLISLEYSSIKFIY